MVRWTSSAPCSAPKIMRAVFSADSAERTARLIFGALQGALLVQRTTGDSAQLKDVITALKSQLRPQS